MASTFDNNLRLREMGTGDESGTWGTRTNENLELIGEALGYGTEAVSGTTHTTTLANGSTAPGRAMYIKYTGSLSSACTITLAPNTVSKLWFIENATSGAQNIVISQGSGSNVTIPNGKTKLVYSDGAGSSAAIVDGLDKIDLGANATLNGGGFSNVTASSSTTFTNKTIDSDSNTITNIANADIKSAAQIDATKIADGSVTSTEFQYINTLSSNAQTQINAKLSNTVDTYATSSEGDERFYFANSGETYYKADSAPC